VIYRSFSRFRLIALLFVLDVTVQAQPHEVVEAGLSQREYAAAVRNLSEPTALFDSNNYISNETGYLHILPSLERLGVRGGVYIGVGPEQNFTYIARIRPEYAFILDIRRENMLEHVLFKVLFEMADSRQTFLSLLLSKPLKDDTAVLSSPTIKNLVDYFDTLEGDEAFFKLNLSRIKKLAGRYELNLSSHDYQIIEKTYRVFLDRHLDLRWEYMTSGNRGINFPSFRDMLLGKDVDGHYGNFLNSDDDFYYIKNMQAANLIVPVTGDFAGKLALTNIAEYIRKRGDKVSAFYLSNVEYYLVSDGLMPGFAENVKRLPITDKSILIRAFVNLRSAAHPAREDNELMTTVMQYVSSFNRLFEQGRYRKYLDVGTADYLR